MIRIATGTKAMVYNVSIQRRIAVKRALPGFLVNFAAAIKLKAAVNARGRGYVMNCSEPSVTGMNAVSAGIVRFINAERTRSVPHSSPHSPRKRRVGNAD